MFRQYRSGFRGSDGNNEVSGERVSLRTSARNGGEPHQAVIITAAAQSTKWVT